MSKKRFLRWCDHCKENSAKIKVYVRKDGTMGRVFYCLNKGCKNRINLPFYPPVQATMEGTT
jgi:intein-encoded DNA endonuclease-like protein